MAGKAYTMREMKAIVEYLTERRAFAEIKGRKMWMEFANSGKTTRTWQSLKETFLKRIMPDIHNPYYKLTLDQVRSFREGKDVAEKEKHNRLEYVTASEESVYNDLRSKNKISSNEPAPTTSKEQANDDLDEEVEKVTGEDASAAKIDSRNRSSADTVVLETYENAEQLQQVLEAPLTKEDSGKPLKDLLIFEPMTPLVKELLEDFETESENEDGETFMRNDKNEHRTVTGEEEQVNLVENTQADDENPAVEHNNEATEINHTTADSNKGDGNIKDVPNETEHSNKSLTQNKLLNEIDATNTNEKENDQNNIVITIHDSDEFVTANSKIPDTEITPNKTKRLSDLTQSGNTTSDTLLPNNQECLDNKKLNVAKNEDIKINGKRASSLDRDNKKQKLAANENDKVIVESIVEIPDTPMVNNEDVIEINSEIPFAGPVVEINSDPKNVTDNSFDAQKDISTNDKPGTNTANDNNIEDTHKNPCLQSVSLFEEQFKTSQYSSDSDDKATDPKENQVEPPQKENEESSLKKVTEINKNNDLNPNKVTDVTNRKVLSSSKVADKTKTKDLTIKKVTKTGDMSPNKITATAYTKDLDSKVTELPEKVKDIEKPSPAKNSELKLQRDKVLANIFGFSNGGASTSRKSHPNHKRYHHRRHQSKNDSNSSEWTSESDSDGYVSPPRPSRHKRKYMKPKSSRILQDPEEGMLYVIFGKNIYPLVKDGKHVKNFVTYKHDSSSDLEEDNYWKKKYVEQKKKLEEYKKLLKDQDSTTNDRASPILPSSAKKTTSTRNNEDIPNGKDQHIQATDTIADSKDEKLVLKFATGQGEELRLEGGWTQISSAIPQMMQMLRNNPTQSKGNSAMKIQPQKPRNSNVSEVVITSGHSTPVITTAVDPEVHEKVNEIETQIFKEIEEREKEEESKENEDLLTVNVAKRRGRPRKSTSPASIPESPAKRPKTAKKDVTDKQGPTDAKETKNVPKKSSSTAITSKKTETVSNQSPTTSKQSTADSKQSTPASKQSTPASKQSTAASKQSAASSKQSTASSIQIEQKEIKEAKAIEQPRRRASRLSKQTDVSEVSVKETSVERIPTKRQISTPRRYGTDSSASDVVVRTRRSATKEKAEKALRQQIDFEDDNVRFMLPPSPPKTKSKPKPQKRKSAEKINELQNINSVDSTQGYQDSDMSPIKLNITKRKRRISLTAHKKNQHRRIKRPYSYPSLMQELMTSDSNSSYFVPVRKSLYTTDSEIYRTDSYQLLVPKPKISIGKLEPIEEATQNTRHVSNVSKDADKSSELNVIVEIGSSSSVSLPLSPEISVVENLSISKEVISKVRPNEPQSNESSDKMDFNEYMISQVDVSMPLMNQQCQPKNKTKTLNNDTFTDTFMNEIGTINIEDKTISDTLDQRLRNLLLESNKKNKGNEQKNAMDVDAPVVEAKKRNKKRCSTPRKKTTITKANAPKDAVIEEEHMESCSLAGRNSCPPIIMVLPVDENANNCDDLNVNKNVRKRKDIIRVKIQRPKDKRLSEVCLNLLQMSVENITTSSCTDSGINDAETQLSGMLRIDDSVDLIHNHSETCLLANECMDNGDSVEFVENSKSTIISLNSSHPSLYGDLQRLLEDTGHHSENLFENADDNANSGPISPESPVTVYHSPAATYSSLMTEDLSDENPINKPSWYLLSEDETKTQTDPNVMVGFGANLKQLFPIACAVPDLSTISENSKENDDSRKPRSNGGDV